MKNLKIIAIVTLFLVSIGLNLYFYTGKSKFEEAWLNQFITTSEIEQLFKASGVDTSFDNLLRIAKSEFGSSAAVVLIGQPFTELGADSEAIGVNDTLLLFKEGRYFGSKANLPDH